MELYLELLGKLVAEGKVHLVASDSGQAIERLLEGECYRALGQIKAILADDRLDDQACFEKIEEIINVFERMGSGGGGRHDFG